MTVLAPDRQLYVVDPAERVDAHGMLFATYTAARGPYPAHAQQQPDGTVEVLLDPACLPLPPLALLSTSSSPVDDPAALVVQGQPEHLGADGPWRALEHVRCVARPRGLVTAGAGR